MKRKAKSVGSQFGKQWHAFKGWLSVTSNVAPWALALLLAGILYTKTYGHRHVARTVASAGMMAVPQGKYKPAPAKSRKGTRPPPRKRH